MGIWHWLVHVMGVDYGTTYGRWVWYNFWSGFGSIQERLAELAGIGYILLHKHNCHQPGCPWVGRFPDDLHAGWAYCRKHHPTSGKPPSEV